MAITLDSLRRLIPLFESMYPGSRLLEDLKGRLAAFEADPATSTDQVWRLDNLVEPGSRPVSTVSDPVRPTLDSLVRTQAGGLDQRRFQIGEYLLREPDCRQILLWAESLEMTPEALLAEFAAIRLEPSSSEDFEPIGFVIEDGAIISLAWDFFCLPLSPAPWEPGLLVRALGYGGSWRRAFAPLRPVLPRLQTLICSFLDLKTVDLSQVQGLTELNCCFNRLTELDLSQVRGLTKLTCGSNQLTKLDISPVPGLIGLDCGHNRLTKLDLSPVPGLTELECENNQLTELDLSPVPGLTMLDCSLNELTELDLSPVPRLTELDCGHNRLTKLDLSPVPGLTKLTCGGNQLTELDLSTVPGLTELVCEVNLLTELDLSPVPGLTKLTCGSNQLTELDLSPVPGLTELTCGSNQLTKLDLSPVPGLTKLTCGSNRLTKLDLSPVPELIELECEDNQLSMEEGDDDEEEESDLAEGVEEGDDDEEEESDLAEIDVDGPDVIGHGDDMVESWGGSPLGEAIAVLKEVLSQGDGAGFAAADWQDIFQSVPPLEELAKHAGGYESIEQLLQDLPGFDCEHHRWGGDSPGLSGCYLVFRAAPADQPSLVDLILELIDAVQTYLEDSEEFAESMEQFEDMVEELDRKKEQLRLAEEERAAQAVKAALQKEEDRIQGAVDMLGAYLANPVQPFCCLGMLLVTEDRWIYWMRKIWGYRYLEEPDFCRAVIQRLQGQYVGVVEVREVVPPGVQLPLIPLYGAPARPRFVGWRHDRTDLQVIGNSHHRDPNQVRSAFLALTRQEPVG